MTTYRVKLTAISLNGDKQRQFNHELRCLVENAVWASILFISLLFLFRSFHFAILHLKEMRFHIAFPVKFFSKMWYIVDWAVKTINKNEFSWIYLIIRNCKCLQNIWNMRIEEKEINTNYEIMVFTDNWIQ